MKRFHITPIVSNISLIRSDDCSVIHLDNSAVTGLQFYIVTTLTGSVTLPLSKDFVVTLFTLSISAINAEGQLAFHINTGKKRIKNRGNMSSVTTSGRGSNQVGIWYDELTVFSSGYKNLGMSLIES